MRTIALYMRQPEPSFVIGENEPALALRFLTGLQKDRLELHGHGNSEYDDADRLMEDVGNFANEELKRRWYSLPDRNPFLMEEELMQLSAFAKDQFKLATFKW